MQQAQQNGNQEKKSLAGNQPQKSFGENRRQTFEKNKSQSSNAIVKRPMTAFLTK